MNYDHRYHAGNFADVVKHVALTRILLYLQHKPAPFRVIDTHAGHGAYDLLPEMQGRIAEWRGGVGRLDPAAFLGQERALISPYLGVVGDALAGETPYPGSPVLALRLARSNDRLLFCEVHPAAFDGLRSTIGRDRRAKIFAIDGYVGLNAFIPPPERRGLIVIDPPFEAETEFDRLGEAISAAHAKWRDGVILAWHPIKDRRGIEGLVARLQQARIGDLLRLEFDVDRPAPSGRLVSCGLLVVNPPFVLEQEMACLLPALQRQLAPEKGAWRMDHRVDG